MIMMSSAIFLFSIEVSGGIVQRPHRGHAGLLLHCEWFALLQGSAIRSHVIFKSLAMTAA